MIGSDVLTASLESALLSGDLYINIHTPTSIGGEIRGQVSCALNAPIGGTLIPIDTTALLVAGAQTMTPWLILGVVAAVGVGFAVFTIKRR